MEIYCIRMEFPTRLSTAIVFSRDILQRVLDKYEEECMACEDISSFQLERYLKNIDTKK